MRRWGLTWDSIMTLAMLLAIGMLLTDLVATGLWWSRIDRLQQRQLENLLAVIAGPLVSNPGAVPASPVLVELAGQGICLVLTKGGQITQPISNTCPEDRDATRLAQSQGLAALGSFSTTNGLIAVGRPIQPDQPSSPVLVLVQHTEDKFARLWTHQHHILIYILVNTLILTVIGFFRFSKRFIRPLDRLIGMADDYRDSGPLLFTEPSQANEIGRLSSSLNAMILRIEEEKRKLAETARELAESNRQLRENQAEMVRAEKLASVGRLAAGLAHEIGNPLGVAQGYLQMMAMEGSEPAEIADYADRARKELERVDGLIRQLLDFARSSRSRRERFDLHDLLAEMADSLRMQPFLEGVELALDLAAEPSTVFADPEQLRQVVLNCLINSADAIRARTPAEGGLIRLVTTPAAEAGKGMLQLAIIDNGEGIEPAMIEAVFDPFFTTKEPGAGTGLGLSVSLSLIESMGGRMRLESAKGEGATITLLLPVDEAGGGAASGPVETIDA